MGRPLFEPFIALVSEVLMRMMMRMVMMRMVMMMTMMMTTNMLCLTEQEDHMTTMTIAFNFNNDHQ